MEKNEDGELVSVLIVEEEEEDEVEGEGCRGDGPNILEQRRGEMVKGEHILEERGQRRAAAGTN